MMGFGYGWGGIVMVVIVVVLVGLGILFLAALFPKVSGNNVTGRPVQQTELPQAATEILKQRYSRGEISKEQLEQMRRDVEA